jgi:adenylosuccinate lyase
MIQRYTHPDMGAIWSDQRRYETWLEVELAAADAMAEAGLIPREAAAELRARADFDPKRIEAACRYWKVVRKPVKRRTRSGKDRSR